jgi:hypothetical protein
MDMASRRGFLKGALAWGAAFGLSGLAMTDADRASAAPKSDAPWYLQNFAGTREATGSELSSLTADLRAAAAAAGYGVAALEAATYRATTATTPRGTRVGRIAAVLDDHSLVALTKEYGKNAFDREALQAFWTDGAQVMDMQPSAHASAMQAGRATSAATMAASTTCCMYPGGSPGTCCVFDYQGLFECCAPCAVALIGGPAGGIACIIIWCNYCYVAKCRQWYRYC